MQAFKQMIFLFPVAVSCSFARRSQLGSHRFYVIMII